MRNKKNNRIKKLLITALTLAMILGLAVGATVAFVLTNTEELENTFVPGKVQVTVQLTPSNSTGTLSSAVVANDKSNIPVYIRVAVVTNWAHQNGGVCGAEHTQQLPTIPLNTAEGWVKGTDGYYYYTKPVPVGQATENLLNAAISLPTATDGCKAQVYVLATAIQAQGTNGENLAIRDAWGDGIPEVQ